MRKRSDLGHPGGAPVAIDVRGRARHHSRMRWMILSLSLLVGCGATAPKAGTSPTPSAARLAPAPPIEAPSHLLDVELITVDGARAQRGVAFMVRGERGDVFAVTSARLLDFAGPRLERIRLRAASDQSAIIDCARSHGWPGSFELDLIDDLLLLPLDEPPQGVAILELVSNVDPARGPLVWVPLRADGGRERLYGRVVKETLGGVQIALYVGAGQAPSVGAPVLSAATGQLVGVVTRAIPEGKTGNTEISVAPMAAVRAAATSLAPDLLLSSLVGEADVAQPASFYYGWRSKRRRDVVVRDRALSAGRVFDATKRFELLTERRAPDGVVARALSKDATPTERPGTAQVALEISPAGHLVDDDAASELPWLEPTHDEETSPSVQLGAAWKWAFQVEQLAGTTRAMQRPYGTTWHLRWPGEAEPRAVRWVSHLTQRVPCDASDERRACMRLVTYVRPEDASPETVPSDQDAQRQRSVAPPQPPFLIREVLVTRTHSLEPVYLRRETNAATGRHDYYDVYALHEEAYAGRDSVCEADERGSEGAPQRDDQRPEPARPDPRNEPPVFPWVARRAGVGSSTLAKITVDEKGDVTDVCIMEGNELFDDAVIEALSKWRFEPAHIGGAPVKVRQVIRLPFMIQPAATER